MFQQKKAGIRRFMLPVLMAGALALFASASAQASIINGGISFNGNVTPYISATGTGTIATDFISAHSLVFGPTVVSDGANGTFAGIASGTPVTMYSPLEINPPQLPIPATAPLWQVTSGGTTYAFTLSTLTEPVDTLTFLVLTGAGSFTDNLNPLDKNTNATWVATFTTSGSTFSWNASSSAPPVIPEPMPAAILLPVAALVLLRRRQRA